jgi:hypothetical protein
MEKPRKYLQEQLALAIEGSFTWADVCRKLNLTTSSNKHLRKRAILLGINFSHFQGRSYAPARETVRYKNAIRRKLGWGDSARNDVRTDYKNGARRRDLIWGLSNQDFDDIVRKDCVYCGRPPSNVRANQNKTGSFTYSGIDRIDNKIGYILSNVVPCCKHCNRAKSDISKQEFLDWACRIANKCRGFEATPSRGS